MSNVNIAIDGPAASGKGTVARGVARALGFQYVDTGAMFRAVAVLARRRGVSFRDGDGLGALVANLRFRFVWHGDTLALFVGEEDLSEDIRTEEAGAGASLVSQNQGVRNALLTAQRKLAEYGGVVMDGRDIGTVVLPAAEIKVFLVAEARVRARRRFEELAARGETVSYASVLLDLERRDHQDRTREIAPLKKAPDAIELDSTHLDASAVIHEVLALVYSLQNTR